MSHAATNWAIKQRGLKPATKIVLWHLCDRYHPDNGCFPSQERLAEDCEMSRSALNAHLQILEDAGLIRRERQHDGKTARRRPTRYRLACEDGFGEQDENVEASHVVNQDMEAMSGFGAEPCPENGDSHVRNPDTNLVREPVREPLERDARAREGSKQTIRFLPPEPDDDAQFDELATLWPMKDKLVEARLVWSEMAPEDRDAALAYAPRYLSGLKGKRSFVEQLATWLRGRAWRVAGGAAAATPVVTLSPYSRTFWAFVFGRLRRGERVGFMIDQAQRGTGPSVRADDMPGPDELAALVPVEVDSPAFDAWQQWFRSRQVASIRPDQARVIWCPSEWPAGMEAVGKAKEVAT